MRGFADAIGWIPAMKLRAPYRPRGRCAISRTQPWLCRNYLKLVRFLIASAKPRVKIMFYRLLVLMLFAAAGVGAAGATSCVDNWEITDQACAVQALKALHEQQLAGAIKANAVLFDADSWHPNRSTGDIADAIGVLAETASMVMRDRPRHDLSGFDFLPSVLSSMQRDFRLQGWSEPADVPAGFRFLQARVRQAFGPERKAIVTAALKSGRGMVYQYEPWIPQMALWRNHEEREDHRNTEAAVRAEAHKNSTYAERVTARFTGSQRFEGKAGGLGHFLTGAILLAALLGCFFAYGAFKAGESLVGIIRILLIVPPAIAVSGILLFAISAFTGDLGAIGFLLWLAGAFLVARPIGRMVRGALPDPRWTTHGSARWANFSDMLAARRARQKADVPRGFALGRAFDAPRRADPRLFYQGHVLTVAPTGKGKGVGAVIPNLLAYEGSAVVLDIKGENYAVTARARAKMGQEICLIDPFGVTRAKGQAINWLDAIDLSNPDCVSVSESLAEMLVIPSAASGDSIHFEETARHFLQGLLLFIATLPPQRRHMGELRRLIALPMEGPGETLVGVLADMAVSDEAFGVIARAANSFMAKPDRERGSVLSTAQRHTAFLEDPRIVAALSRSDFTLTDLKTKAKTVYIVLPPSKLSAQSRFLRGFTGLALASITASNMRPEHPVVFMLDEFAQLGRMAAIEDAIPLVRGYGASFWIFVQDLSQLKAVYPKWQSFLANAAQQFFSVADYDTAHYVSSMLGQRTVEFRTAGTSSQDFKFGHSSTSSSQQFTGRALLTPDEVMNSGQVIAFIAGEQPYRLQRLNYLSDPEYAGLADPNPYYA
jgi:type IV secretory pathway TraG/TraD family ATPase VirD4